MEQEPQSIVPVKPPRGMFAAKIDDKGRLKLPAEIQRYLAGFPENKFFVTSLNRRIAIIYPVQIWEQNEKFFEDYTANTQARDNIKFNANDLGSDEEMDAQGRLPISSQLRRELNLENQQVRLQVVNRSIQVLGDAMYQEWRARAIQSAESDVKLLHEAGLK